LQGGGQIMISSSSPDQISWESKHYANSVFTRSLIDSLQSYGGKTTIDQAFQNMKEKVEQEVVSDRGVLQTPVYKTKWIGQSLAIATPPAHPRTSSVKPDSFLSASQSEPEAKSLPIVAAITSPLPQAPPAVSSRDLPNRIAV